MQDAKVGSLLRALRIRRGWRQADLATAAGVSSSLVSEIEAGRLERTSVRRLRSIARALGASIEVHAQWHGGEADRVLSAGHSRLHEAISRFLEALPGWIQAPEVAFAIGGERGIIDILAFHPAARSLLIIELKTELTDLSSLLAVTSRRLRLGVQIAAARGWQADTISAWVVVAESATSRRVAARHASMLRSALPADGHAIRAWLLWPRGRIAALSFWSDATRVGPTQRIAPRRRVRLRPSRSGSSVLPTHEV